MPLTGKRVQLRALEMRDLEAIQAAYTDFDMALMTDGDAPPLSDRQVRAFWEQRLESPAPEMRYFVIEPLAGQPFAGQFAGLCNLHDIDWRNRHAELAMWLAAPDQRGQGFGTDAIRTLLPYAFEVTRLDKVHLGVYAFNEGAIRAYERVGFRYEGRLRQQIFYKGRYWDEWPMRLLRSEWDVIARPPVEGLRPYHPADLDAALALIQRLAPTPDLDTARVVLRRWWRRIDWEVYAFQTGQTLSGLCATSDEARDESPERGASVQRLTEALIEPAQRDAFEAALTAQGIAR